MKTFFLCMFAFTIASFGIYGVSKSVHFKPWTKTGQEEEYKEFKRIVSIPVADPKSTKKPLVECEVREYDFGTMPPFAEGAYTFKVTNRGNDQLVLKNGGASCSCLDSDLSAVLVPPGDTKEIVVSWSTEKAGKLSQYLKVKTNCPEVPELQLWIHGMVKTVLGVSVNGFYFDSLVAGETRNQNFHVFSELWRGLEIDRIETSSPDVLCEIAATPSSEAEFDRIVSDREKPVEQLSRIDFRLSVKAQQMSGERVERIKIFARPPVNRDEQASFSNLRQDGTVLLELPVSTRVVRKLSLYGPAISNGDKKLIDLGKLRTNSPARDWVILAKIRGDDQPESFSAELSGIEGVSASVEKVEGTTSQVGTSYRIRIHAAEKLRLGVYNGAQSGRLTILAPGLEGEERLEFIVELDVLEEN